MLPMLLVMLAYGVIHSLLAGQTSKQTAKQLLGDRLYHGVYRLVYNMLAGLLLIPAAYLLLFQPGATVWEVSGPIQIAFRAVQLIGLIGLLISLVQIDLGQFTGLSQLRAYLQGIPLPLPAEPLQTGGVYAFVRHPLYLFSLLVIWFMPAMSESLLAFNIGATVYFILGSLLEEQRLTRVFGQEYVAYQKKVGWLIPFVHTKRS